MALRGAELPGVTTAPRRPRCHAAVTAGGRGPAALQVHLSTASGRLRRFGRLRPASSRPLFTFRHEDSSLASAAGLLQAYAEEERAAAGGLKECTSLWSALLPSLAQRTPPTPPRLPPDTAQPQAIEFDVPPSVRPDESSSTAAHRETLSPSACTASAAADLCESAVRCVPRERQRRSRRVWWCTLRRRWVCSRVCS